MCLLLTTHMSPILWSFRALIVHVVKKMNVTHPQDAIRHMNSTGSEVRSAAENRNDNNGGKFRTIKLRELFRNYSHLYDISATFSILISTLGNTLECWMFLFCCQTGLIWPWSAPLWIYFLILLVDTKYGGDNAACITATYLCKPIVQKQVYKPVLVTCSNHWS